MVEVAGGDIAFVRVLGPIQVVTTAGLALDLPSVSQRRLLARLAVDAPRALRAELLCDVLAVSPGALRTVVSRLRKKVGNTTVTASQARYRLTVPVDAALFAAALARAETSEDRIRALERALALWTGQAFEEFAAEAWAEPEVARLAELHASAVEQHASELILARRWPEAIAELKAHVSANPLRDRPWGRLIQALGGAGRQADALAAFREYRAYLAEWVGTEPSAQVRRVQERIAAGWDGIEELGRPGSPRSGGPPAEHGNGWLPLPAELARGPAVVGRTRELELLAAEAAQAAGSGLRTVIVEGEAGIGKTAVLGEFARAVGDKGSAAVLYGRCQDGPAVPLEPFRSLIGYLVKHAPTDVLRAHVARRGGQLGWIAPGLADRVAVVADAPGDGDERHLLFEAVSDLLTRLAAISSLVVLVDDVQWAEPTALELLRHLGRTLADVPVLLVLAARDTDERRPRQLRDVLADLECRPGRRVRLGGLDDGELTGLTASLLAVDPAAVSPAVSTRLREQTAGNPLYVTQLVRHWTESGHLALAASQVGFSGDAAGEVPASLQNLLSSRVSLLGEHVVEVLSAAAVLGTQFAVSAVIDVTGMAESDAMDALEAAEAAGLLAEVETRTATLRFVHVLVARAVYAALPRGQRRRWHAQAARVLEQRVGTATMSLAAQVAWHYNLGAMPDRARRWAMTAGDYAASQLAPAEAARWYRIALGQSGALDVSDHERADLLIRLGHAEQRVGDPGSRATLTEAAALARGATTTTGPARAGIVGRHLELDLARNAVRDLCEGQGSTLLIEGEGGVGKTRMVQCIVDDARAHGVSVYCGAAHPFERGRPFGAIAAALDLNRRSRDPRRAAIGRLLGGAIDPAKPRDAPDIRYRVVEEILDLGGDVVRAAPSPAGDRRPALGRQFQPAGDLVDGQAALADRVAACGDGQAHAAAGRSRPAARGPDGRGRTGDSAAVPHAG